MTDPVVCMPWREEPARLNAHRRVMKFWQDEMGYEVVEGDSYQVTFQLAEARNHAVDLLSNRDGPLPIIVADADAIPEPHAIRAALEIVSGMGDMVVYPYENYLTLPEKAATAPDDLALIDPLSTNHHSVSGVFVTDTDTYWKLGGMDEKFRGWGFEDSAFACVAVTLARVVRIPGVVYAFDHPVSGPGRVHGSENPNYYRNELYKMCTHSPKLMQELLK